MGQDKVTVSIDQLTVGVTCSQPIFSDGGVLLVGSDTRITQQVITGLRDRGFESIEVDPRDLGVLNSTERKKLAPLHVRKKDETRGKDGEWVPGKPVKEMLVDRNGEPLSGQRTVDLANRIIQAKKKLDALQSSLMDRTVRSLTQIVDISEGYIAAMIEDHDQTVGSLALITAIEETSAKSVTMSGLGMAIAIEMELDGLQTVEVGLAGLLHDVGLYAMDPILRGPLELLSVAQLWDYQKHPMVAAKWISDLMEIPHSVQIAIEQVHEQFDGSGFPRGVKAQRIHKYARILNVVDAYLQLTTPTPQRPGIIPHDALGMLLHRAGEGLFDPAVIRAFLNVESLFPLGSHVELTSGEVAQVIRRPRSGFADPVVQTAGGDRIELESSKIQIVRPTASPKCEQSRLSPEIMISSTWNPAFESFQV